MRTPRRILQRCKAIVGRRCHLVRQVRTRSGKVYEPMTLWKITSTWRGTFCIEGITRTGRVEMRNGCIARYVRGVSRDAFEMTEDHK